MTANNPKHIQRLNSGLYPAVVTLIWWPVIAFTLYNYLQYAQKYVLLAYARSLGLSHNSELSVAQFLLVFSKTSLFLGIVVPTATFVACYLFRSRIIPAAVLIISLCAILLNFTNLLSIANTGSLMTWRLLLDSAVTAFKHPDLASTYVSFSSILKVLALLLLTYAIYVLAIRKRSKSGLGLSSISISITILCILGFFPSLYLYAKVAAGTTLEPGVDFLSEQLEAMLDLDIERSSVFDGLSFEEATQLYQDTVNAPESGMGMMSRLFGTQKESNLIIVGLETGPSQVIDYKSNDSFVNLRSLADRGIAGAEHYSTNPYTSDALFSLFSSLYPNGLRRHLFNEAIPGRGLNASEIRIGLFNALSNSGYSVKMYLPWEPLFESDDKMFAALGARDIFFPTGEETRQGTVTKVISDAVGKMKGYDKINAAAKVTFEGTLAKDVLALDELLKDIRENALTEKPFASIFLPQLGHGPWPILEPHSSLMKTGEDLFAIQDDWLGDIFNTLEEAGLEDNTVIVVSADHGLRTRSEYPELKPGTLNDISFRVPLVIYAPRAFSEAMTISHLTSHIDIAPSILSLLGINDPKLFMLGSELWNPRLNERRTYLLANSYLGVDGYKDNGVFETYHELSGSANRGYSLHRQDDDLSVEQPSAAGISAIRKNIEFQLSFQQVLKRHLLKSEVR